MTQQAAFASSLRAFCSARKCRLHEDNNEFTLTADPFDMLDVMAGLKDQPPFQFEQLIDIAGVDYLEYGRTEWKTRQASASGFSRGISKNTFGRFTFEDNTIENTGAQGRFAVVYHLLSVSNNKRLRVKIFCDDNDHQLPAVKSVCGLWNSANWYEREAFDLYGIVFEGHPDMRRLLTDYGFVGHPLRKDFPLVGHVEMRFDPAQQRVVYEPVTIEPRVLVPKVIRADHRHRGSDQDGDEGGGSHAGVKEP